MDRRKFRQRSPSRPETPSTPSSPMASASPLNRHARSGSNYGGIGNVKKAQTKAAAQRLAAVMANQYEDDDEEDQLEISGTGGIGLAGGRATRSRSPMNKNMAQRRVPQVRTPQPPADEDNDEDDVVVSGTASIGLAGGRGSHSRSPMKNLPQRRAPLAMAQQPADEENDEDGLLVSGTASIGLAGGRAIQSRSPAKINIGQRRVPQVTTQQPADEDDDEDDLLVKGTASIGLGGRSMQSRSPMTKNLTQKRLPQNTTQQPSDNDDDEDDVLVSGKPIIGLARGRAMQSRPSMAKTMAQRPVQQVAQQPSDEDSDDHANNNSSSSGTTSIGIASGRARPQSSPLSVHTNQEQTPSTRSTPGTRPSLSFNSMEKSASSNTRPSHSLNSVEQTMSPYSTSAGRPSMQSSLEKPYSTQSSTAGRSSPLTSIEQPLSARSQAAGRQHLGVKTVTVVPSTLPMSVKPPVSTTDASTDSQREKRLSADIGSKSILKERGTQQSASALQDELDMLQDENESLLEKLQLAEDRCEEAEERARQLEKQAALRVAAQTHGGKPEEIASLRAEAETARDEATSTLEKLHETECEVRALQTVIQRLMLTEEEMEEVVLKRCWLARYWSLCVQHGIQAEIAGKKYEYWSSFAPLPVEIVLAAGQRALEGDDSSNNDLEEREKVLLDFSELSDRNVESMLLVEKGLRELALLKVEDAVAYAMAKNRRQNMLKTDEVKLPTEGQFEAFAILFPSEMALRTLYMSDVGKENTYFFVLKMVNRTSMLILYIQKNKEYKDCKILNACLRLEKDRLCKMALIKKQYRLGSMKSLRLVLNSFGFHIFLVQAWLAYFWRRAVSHGVEPEISDERLQFWINHGSRASISHDAVDVERGLLELRRLGLESQLWKKSRQGLEIGSTTKLHIETDF
ncbi:hypothetical protein COLO4_36052 [Corchorus olitorius]|uniref:Coiled-coil domain-containing protein SCD2 n=1 Tax=Corchorus olitorius TaxID=93759 RepID=A0A1R3GB64_9ROSI|nr:hypothetical protein COLO4_36052 [Corchorus olitorius]